jgi:hypothetical protein
MSEPRYDLVVKIQKAEKEFHSGWFEQLEKTECSVQIEVLDHVRTPYAFAATGEGFYTMKSAKLDPQFLEKLYRKIIQTCIFKAMETLSTFKTPDNASQPRPLPQPQRQSQPPSPLKAQPIPAGSEI